MSKSIKSDMFARFAKIRTNAEAVASMKESEKIVRRDQLGKLLADVQASDVDGMTDLAKKIRRSLRATGHYISRKGKPWMNAAKKTRKSNANAKAADVTITEAVDANANA